MSALVNRPRIKIVLHGRLAKKFGGPFEWGIRDPADAIRGLCQQRAGFREELARGHYRVERRDEGGKRIELDKDALTLGLGRAKELHIFPVARGAKSGAGAIKIIIGVILIAVAWYVAAPLALGGLGAGFGTAITIGGVPLLGLTFGGLAGIGIGMVLGGAAMLLAPKVKAPKAGDSKTDTNFMFNGPQMVQEQGVPVPLNYGDKVRAGGVLIAVDYRAEDLEVANQGTSTGTGIFGVIR